MHGTQSSSSRRHSNVAFGLSGDVKAKVGVASLYINRIYRRIAETVESVSPTRDPFDLEEVLRHYDPQLRGDIVRLNTPTVTGLVDPETLRARWPDIRRIILNRLPPDELLLAKMRAAGAAVTLDEIHVTPALMEEALRYHAYMRYRILLTRLLPMLGLDVMDYAL